MAEKLKMTQSAYSRIESGKTKLSLEQIKPIADALEIDPMQLLEEFTFNNTFESQSGENQSGGISNAGIMINYGLSEEQTNFYEEKLLLKDEKIKLLEDKLQLKEEEIKLLREKLKK